MVVRHGGLLRQQLCCALLCLHSLGLSRGQLRLQQRDMDVGLREPLLQLLDVDCRRTAKDAGVKLWQTEDTCRTVECITQLEACDLSCTRLLQPLRQTLPWKPMDSAVRGTRLQL